MRARWERGQPHRGFHVLSTTNSAESPRSTATRLQSGREREERRVVSTVVVHTTNLELPFRPTADVTYLQTSPPITSHHPPPPITFCLALPCPYYRRYLILWTHRTTLHQAEAPAHHARSRVILTDATAGLLPVAQLASWILQRGEAAGIIWCEN